MPLAGFNTNIFKINEWQKCKKTLWAFLSQGKPNKTKSHLA